MKIEKNVPLTKKKAIPIPIVKVKRKFNYPFEKLKLNDSFLIEEVIDTKRKYSTIMKRISNYSKDFKNRQFTSRLVENGIRVWRIK